MDGFRTVVKLEFYELYRRQKYQIYNLTLSRSYYCTNLGHLPRCTLAALTAS